jgi:hypothetical protein
MVIWDLLGGFLFLRPLGVAFQRKGIPMGEHGGSRPGEFLGRGLRIRSALMRFSPYRALERDMASGGKMYCMQSHGGWRLVLDGLWRNRTILRLHRWKQQRERINC